MDNLSAEGLEYREVVAAILSRARDANGETDHDVANELVTLGPKAVPVLIRTLGDSDMSVREVAAIALAELNDPSAIPALREAALVRNSRTQMQVGAFDAQIEAIVALGKLRATEALDDLICLMEYGLKSDTTLAQYVIDAIGLIGDEKAIPHLQIAAHHPHPDVGRDVQRAIEHIRLSTHGEVPTKQ